MRIMHFSVLLAAAVALGACTSETRTTVKPPIRVATEVVAATPDAALRQYVGVVEEAQATAVSFTSMGTVRRVLVSEGQHVSRGQLIAEMDDTQARNILEAAQAGATQAEDALARYQLLHDRGSMTDAQWVEIQSKVAQARSQLALARKSVADCRLTAPVSGIIGRKNVSAGETAMPSQAVVTILDITSVKVKFSVPEAEVAAITPSTPTRITIDALATEVQGGTIEKGVKADPLTHTYDLRARVNNKEARLLPGMVAKVSIAQPQTADASATAAAAAVTAPLIAVQRRADGSLFVWTLGADSTARRTPVTIGATAGNRVHITSGIAAGTRIVTEGYQKLSEGTKTTF